MASKVCEIRSHPTGAELGLLLQMTREGDRYHTSILLIEPDNGTVPLLESCEGSSNDSWPASPPLQEVLLQSDEGRPYLAGLGSAGSGLWSLIVAPVEGHVGFEFDYACRTAQAPVWLGCRYRPTGCWTHLQADSLDFESGPRLSFHDGQGPGCRRICQDGQLQIEALVPAEVAFPTTLRWKYRVMLDS